MTGSSLFTTPIAVLDLFAGAGGLSLGFEHFNRKIGNQVFRATAFAEMDPIACETLRLNHPDCAPRIIEGDLTETETHDRVCSSLEGHAIGVVVGGPPCQSFSTIGTRSGKWVGDERYKQDKRDKLFLEYIKLVAETKPAFVVIENVCGFLSKKDEHGSSYYSQIISGLGALGYRFDVEGSQDNHLILNAADYGVPQIRHRVFIIGNRLGLTIRRPVQTHCNPNVPPCTETDRLYPWVTLRDAIGDLPSLEAHYTKTGLTSAEWERYQALNRSRYCGEDEQPYAPGFLAHLNSLGAAGREFLTSVAGDGTGVLRYHVARAHQVTDIQLFAAMPQGSTSKDIFEGDPSLFPLRKLIKYDMGSFKDKYRRQRWNQPGTTVFAHLERDGNRFIHPSQPRTLTVRECARLQSFPDTYLFAGTMKSRFRQIGNAVPPLLARAVAESIYEALCRG